ncbi:MAG: hypothetical protein CUR34_00990 [Sediminibacterium sp.]|nr:MAG: hypothetical protein CUR34_00990 [Sediminibacterium sp.] [Sediminibacterium sp. FEMGT703S]
MVLKVKTNFSYRILCFLIFYIIKASAFGQGVSPNADFSFSPITGCGRTTINFTNASDNGTPPLTNGLSYQWDFGDGGTSTDLNPTHIFNPGSGTNTTTFNVTLRVTNQSNVSATITKQLTLNKGPDSRISSNVALTSFNGESYFRVCGTTPTRFDFSNASSTTSTNTRYVIKWGDGSPDYDSPTFNATVSHIYAVGLNKLTFFVYSGSCVDSSTYNIFIGNVPAGGIIGTGGSTICTGNEQKFLIIGANNNPPGTIYRIDFSDGSPIREITNLGSGEITHQYLRSSCGTSSSNGLSTFQNAFGAYLTIENPCGVALGSIIPIYVSNKPTPNFTSSRDTVCGDQTVVFANAGTVGNNAESQQCTPGKTIWRISSVSPGASFTMIAGTLGNGNNTLDPNFWTAGTPSVEVRFNAPGLYNITQVTATNALCGIDSLTKTICVNPTPTASFTTNANNGCAPFIVTANGVTNTPQCGTNRFVWSVDYEPIAGCVPTTASFNFVGGTNANSQNPQFEFLNPGLYTINLLVIAPGGACTSLVVKQQITVKGKPVISINAIADICQNSSISPSVIANCFTSAATYNWTFNGGIPTSSTLQSPGNISYAAAGNYTVLLSATNECGVTNDSRSFSVKDLPTVNVPSNLVKCAGTLSGALNFTSNSPSTSFTWTNSNTAIGLPASGTGSSINNFTLTNSTNAPITATITVTPLLGACSGLPQSFTITVNPNPVAPTVQNIAYCQGAIASQLTATGDVGNTLLWYNSLTGGSGSAIAPTPITTNATTLSYFVSQQNALGCESPRATLTVVINPTPTINNQIDTVCSATPFSSPLRIPSNTTMYTWNTPTITGGLTGGANGTGVRINGTLINPTNTAQTATYLVTPTIGTCVGPNFSMTIVVSPKTKLPNYTQTICSGSAFVVEPKATDAADAILVNGTTYTWGTPVVSTPGAVTGAVAEIVPQALISQTLVNLTNQVVTVTYTVTPRSSSPGICDGDPFQVVVRVLPKPQIQNQVSTICSGSSFDVDPLNNLPNTIVPVGTTYTWGTPVSSPLGAITGGTASASPQNKINQTLINNTSAVAVLTYTVTPQADGCVGTPFEINVTVNPALNDIPVIVNSSPICVGGDITLTVSNPIPLATYTWSGPNGFSATTTNPSLTRTGAQLSFSGTYSVIASLNNCFSSAGFTNVTVNTVPAAPTVTSIAYCQGTVASPLTATGDAGSTLRWYNSLTGGSSTFTAPTPNTSNTGTQLYFVSQQSAQGCESPRATLAVEINPTPNINNQIDTVCSATPFSSPLRIPSSAVIYTWNTPSVTGGLTGGVNGTGNRVNGTLINPTNIAQTATYLVTPTIGTCVGPNFTLTMVVSPKTKLPNYTQSICSGSAFTIEPKATDAADAILVNGTTYTWGTPVVSIAGAIAGATAETTPQSLISQSLVNLTNQLVTVTYTVTPRSSSPGSCDGDPFQVVVTVLPKPLIQNINQTICSGNSFDIAPSNNQPNTIVPTATTYTWGTPVSNPIGAITSGLAAGSPQNKINQTLFNTTTSVAVLTYIVTPQADGCAGTPFEINITVNPQPGITDQQATICSGTQFAVAPTGVPAGTTYTWGTPISNPIGAITGGSAAAAPQPSIAQILQNITNAPATLTYTVSPTAGSCGNSSFLVVVTVNPIPVIASQTVEICNGGTVLFNPINAAPTTIVPSGTTYTWTTPIVNPAGLIQGGTAQNIPQPFLSQVLTNSSNRPATITYTITPQSGAAGNCLGNPIQLVATVNPDVKASFAKSVDTACAPFNINASILSNTTALTSSNNFSWYVNNQLVGTGYNFPGYTIATPNESVLVKLVANSSFGCKNDSVETRFYTYRKPDASFIASASAGCGPIQIRFTNQSSQDPNFKYLWNFGNGQTSTLYQPSGITFQPNPASGDTVYKVTLLSFNQCDTVKAETFITVYAKPISRFTPSKSTGCSPLTVVFNNTSAGQVNSYTWDFGDGTIQTVNSKNPVSHLFVTGVKDTFYVKLIAQNDCGRDTSIFPLVVTPNTIRLDVAVSGIEQNGCAPHTVRFFNNSSGASLFRWDFGDGNSRTTSRNIDTILHTFTTPGSYNVQVFASNNCSDTSTTELVQVFGKPTPNFTSITLNSCIGDSVSFVNQSGGNPNSYTWKFGDGNTSNLSNPIHRFLKTGTYQVTLIASKTNLPGNVCIDSITRNIIIRDSLPIDFFLSETTSNCAPFNVSVRTDFQDYSTIEWDFGDGTKRSGTSSSHTYLKTGVYTIRLTIQSRTGCTFTSTKEVRLTAPEGTMQFKTGFHCINNAIRFEAIPLNTDSIIWNFGDGTELVTTDRVIFYQYKNPGTYTPSARFKSRNGCEFIVPSIGEVKIDRLTSGFRTVKQEVCDYTDVQFIDSSNAFFGINNIRWSFGNGLSQIGATVSTRYDLTNNYLVQQLITSNSGCVDTVIRSLPIFVKQNPLAQISLEGVVCNNTAQQFLSKVQSVDKVTFYKWQFSNGATGDEANIAITFPRAGNFDVTLITGTEFSCFDTAKINFTVNLTPTIVATPPTVVLCKGNTVNLTATGGNTYTWFPNEGLSCTNCATPIASPQSSIAYIVKGASTNGCFAFDTVDIKVVQPIKMEFGLGDTICIGQSTNLFARGAFSYSWSPALGLNRIDIPNPIASPTVTTRYQVIGRDENNCFADTATMLVAVGQYPVVSLGPDTTLASGDLYPLRNIVTNGPIRTWEWTPPLNLNCTNCPEPIATIKNSITYRLKATNIFGCAGSDTINIKAICENTQVFIPNAFTPDNNGKNDIFMVRGKGILQVKSMRIFNRWGQMVFDKSNFPPNDPAHGWNGRINNIEGGSNVFAYIVEVICENGTPFFYRGNVTLIK